MRKSMILAGSLTLVAAPLAAQTVRWNDRATAAWTDEAPSVRLTIEGSRSVGLGVPVRIRFEVSDNAFVTVVRVDDYGRMTILFPYSRAQRASVRAGMVHYVRNPRVGGQAAFYGSSSTGGYIFALASYAPLDFSSFENRDYDRVGGYSRFSLATRSIARRPDVFIDRFAATVLWDTNTPYDYDVDYYFGSGYPMSASPMNAYALCSSMFDHFGAQTFGGAWQYDWDNWAFTGYPYRSMCRQLYMNARCAWFGLYSYSSCNLGTIIATGPVVPTGKPGDTAVFVPNEGVVRGGLFAPTPAPIPVATQPEPPPLERANGRFDQVKDDDLDDITSIPVRATRKMKEDDARRAAGGGATPSRSAFDGSTAKPEKTRQVADAPERIQPPPREPTKSKATGEGRDTRSKTGYGNNTGRTTSSGADRDRVRTVSEPRSTSTGSTSSGGTLSGTSTSGKTKPPQ